jgi:phage terminase large subunit-like protein
VCPTASCCFLQDQCQHLLSSLKQVQHHLHQQQQQQPRLPSPAQQPEQQQQQQPQPSDPAMPITPSLAQAQAELQLVDCRRQLAEAKAALQELSAALQAEKAARLAAQDAEAGWQQLLQRIAGLQADSVELHGQLLAERKAAAALREELSLTSTSRDTWRVSRSVVLALDG